MKISFKKFAPTLRQREIAQRHYQDGKLEFNSLEDTYDERYLTYKCHYRYANIQYRVAIYMNSQQKDTPVYFDCSACGSSFYYPCEHFLCACMHYEDLDDMTIQRGYTTSPIIHQYIQENTHAIGFEQQEDHFQLALEVVFDPYQQEQQIGLKLSHNQGRYTVIKDIGSLFGAVHQKVPYEISKKDGPIKIHHHQFDRGSKQLYRQLRSLIHSTRYIRVNPVVFDELCTTCLQFQLPIFVKMDRSLNHPYFLNDSTRQLPLSIHLTKQEQQHGYSLSIEKQLMILGNEFVYTIDEANFEILRLKLNTQQYEALLQLQRSMRPLFIDDHDFDAFCYRMLPMLRTFANVDIPLQVELPQIETPSLQVQLDIQNQAIAIYPSATYSFGEYDLFDPTNENIRNINVEKNLADQIKPYLTTANTIEDNDQILQFLEEGLPQLEKIVPVYISDQFKTMRKITPNLKFGLSIQGNSLQLDTLESNLQPKQMQEILSKYDPKKKYYRLKNGDFVYLNQQIKDWFNLQSHLQIPIQKYGKTTIELPRYRLFYLEKQLSSNQLIQAQDTVYQTLKQAHDILNITYPLPDATRSILRQYQKQGYHWLRQLHELHFGALLADEMGLGKTIQVLTFLRSLKNHQTLIVTPASLQYNWLNEIQRFTPDLKTIFIQGTQAVRQQRIEQIQGNVICITSYDSLKRDIELYQDLHFDVEIIDEAQYIKNGTTLASQGVKHIHADFKIALTGTPIENRLAELWSIFDYLMPGFLGTYSYFKKMYELPIFNQDTQVEQELIALVSPFILRRTKKAVLHDLPEKMEEVYYVPLEDEQQKLYDAQVAQIKHLLATKNEDDQTIEVLSQIMRLRQICCDPRLYYNNYTGPSAKTELCLQLIQQAIEDGHKILLFSQFTSMLDILTKRLHQQQIPFHLLTGQTPPVKRAEMVNAFQHDDVPVFCISLKAGGTGLNLTAADIVIHFDPWWNTAVQNQASDRAHRIGQKNAVTIYQLITKDTIEDRILQLQKNKHDLADRILNVEEMKTAKFDVQTLLNLI